MYVASYEPTIEPEMQDFLDNNLLEGKSPKIYVTQRDVPIIWWIS